MKIHGSILVLLGAARLAASQSVSYPSCTNQLCFNTAKSSFCSTGGWECACSSNSYYFFLYTYYCSQIYCTSAADVTMIMQSAVQECKNQGFDPSDTVNSIVESPLEIPTTFIYPSLSLPIETNSLPFIFDSPSQTITSSNKPTGSPKTTKLSSDSEETSSSDSDKSGLSTGAIIGLVVGGVAVIAIIAGLIVFCTKHRAKERRRQAMNAPPPASLPAPAPAPAPPAPVMSPPPMSQYSSPTPPIYPAYTPPIYPPQQQPIFQQQQQPLMEGYQELQGYYGSSDEKTVPVTTTTTTTTTTPASLPTDAPREYFQELAGDDRPRPAPAGHTPAPVGHTPAPVGHTLAQADQIYVEMPADSQRR